MKKDKEAIKEMKGNSKMAKVALYAVICTLLSIYVGLRMKQLAAFKPKGLDLYSGGFEELMIEIAIMLAFDLIFLQYCYIPAGILAGVLFRKKKGFIIGLFLVHGIVLISFLIIITMVYQEDTDVSLWLKINLIGGTLFYSGLYFLSSFISKKVKMLYARHKKSNTQHSLRKNLM